MASRLFMHLRLTPPGPAGTSPQVRLFQPGDVPALGDLMFRAYRGTVDDDGGTPAQAAEEVARTLAGEYGEFLPACSTVWIDGSTIRSAVLITRFQQRPLVAFAFTDPAMARRGLARACLQAAMGALLQGGEEALRLVVTRENEPAVRLYRSLGFQPEPA